MNLTQLNSYKALAQHVEQQLKCDKLQDYFANDKERAQKMLFSHHELYIDLSKNKITDQTISMLINLAKESGLASYIEDLFSGAKINRTENRAVLHPAMRDHSSSPLLVDGLDVKAEFKKEYQKATRLAEQIRCGQYLGITGKRIKHIVHVGIGGSALGPQLILDALQSTLVDRNLSFHFVVNIDPEELDSVLKRVSPEETLFIIVSKTFSTIETKQNFESIQEWFYAHPNFKGYEISSQKTQRHFVAITSKADIAISKGFCADLTLSFSEHIGGRYSCWSTVSFLIMIAIGADQFDSFLKGAYDLDQHFRTAEFNQNIPVLLALIDILYINFFGCQSQAILCYDERLSLLPSYLQQLEMESNGKSTNLAQEKIHYPTSCVIFGQTGTNAQHAFFQLFHQGNYLIPCDFLIFQNTSSQSPYAKKHHRILKANYIAQMESLMMGRPSLEENAPHADFEGNRPSTALIIPELTPYYLGMLLAIYEHRTFVKGAIWQVNSFDQFGVELGKQRSQEILDLKSIITHDSSTMQLMKLLHLS